MQDVSDLTIYKNALDLLKPIYRLVNLLPGKEYKLKSGKKLYLLGEGRLINLAAAEGHPASVMDMSFANQALAAEHVAKNHKKLSKKVYNVPKEIDEKIALLKLKALGIRIDTLTKQQQKYLLSQDIQSLLQFFFEHTSYLVFADTKKDLY